VNLEHIRWFVDLFDLGQYYDRAKWIVGEGTLYRDVWSEYPLLPNLLFGVVRAIGAAFGDSLNSFVVVWVAICAAAYAWLLRSVWRDEARRDRLQLLMWLAPAPIYFALWRFDLFPAIATWLALRAASDERFRAGALWLGVAVAFKGYALFLLPAYASYVFARRGAREAITNLVIGGAPFAASLVVVFAFAGYHGVRMPFLFHSGRGLNGESTYDALAGLAGVTLPPSLWGFVGATQWLQLAVALGAAALRPKTFDELVRAMLIAVVGFVAFSAFHSPQWMLWVLPVAYFSTSRAILGLAVAYGWVTWLFFPVAFDLAVGGVTLPRVIALGAVALLRIAMLFVAARSQPSARSQPA
jgi:hypothetical protein